MVVAGVARLGRYTAFVSHSVMTGFLTGVAVNIVLGQLPDLFGVEFEADTPVAKVSELFGTDVTADAPSTVVGVAAIVLLAWLPRTRLARFSALVALAVPSIVVAAIEWFDPVELVSDVGDIPRGIPLPALPDLSVFSLDLLVGALAVAAITLVQGAGVAESVPNPDGSRARPSTDFTAQGLANVAAGLFRGMPVGGSVSQTALNVAVGARDRWASIMSGVWMLAILIALSGVAGRVATPTLAAVLIVASIGSIKPGTVSTVWQAGLQARIAMATTFVATLTVSIPAAVGVGVAVSLLLSVAREGQDLRVVAWEQTTDGITEQPVPATLEPGTVTVLNVHGSLFYVGARTFERQLPRPAERAVVVVRVRGRSMLGATAFAILSDYAGALDALGGRLYLSGVSHELVEQFAASGRVTGHGPITVVEASPVIGEATRRAIAEGELFLLGEGRPVESHPQDPAPWARRVSRQVRGWFRRDEEL